MRIVKVFYCNGYKFSKLKHRRNGNKLEKIVEYIFLICALFSILSLAVIVGFIFVKGTPALFKIGFFNFILGLKWSPQEEVFGVFPMIVASLISTTGAVFLSFLVGLLTAIFLAEIAPKWIAMIFRPGVELLAGIPSVVYGFFGLIVVVPLIDKWFGGGGNSLLAVIIILSIMILPTIISISELSLRAVPKEYKEGSLALGATHLQTIFKVLIPASKSGIITSIVLGTGRTIGETMAVILVAGNSPILPNSLFSRIRTLTANIALEMGYAYGLHQDVLFATGIVLFIFILVINLILNFMIYKSDEKTC